jgi:hypothetical protein
VEAVEQRLPGVKVEIPRCFDDDGQRGGRSAAEFTVIGSNMGSPERLE